LTAAGGLRFDFLLRAGLQRSRSLSFRAHALNCCHYIILLSEKCVPQIGGPLNVARKSFDHIGECGQSLNARVPRLLGNGISQSLILQAGVLPQPLLELDEFDRIGRGHQRLA
jgi:hypothetical protein